MDELPRRGMGIWNYLLVMVVLFVIYIGQKMIGVEIVDRTMEKSIDRQTQQREQRGSVAPTSFGHLQDEVETLQAELDTGNLGAAQVVVNKHLINKAGMVKKDKSLRAKWLEYYDLRQQIILSDIKF